MEMTLDIPESLIEGAKKSASTKNMSLEEFASEALYSKMREMSEATKPKLTMTPEEIEIRNQRIRELHEKHPVTPELREELRRIQSVIDEEFGQVDPLER